MSAPPAAPGADSARRAYLYMALAVLTFSTTPVLIRWGAPLSPFQITGLRLAVGALTVGLLARWRGEDLRCVLREPRRFALYGLVAALHFLSYIASLSFTTVAHSLSIVHTAPVFAVLLSALFLRETLGWRAVLGMAVTVAGVAILAGFEPRFSAEMLWGDLLALVSAVTLGVYSVMGRAARARYPLLGYAAGLYGFAALWLAPVALAQPGPGVTWTALLAVVLLGIFPLGVGHTLFNASARRIHAAKVNLLATQEVTGGIILSALLLGEIPSAQTLLGCVVALAGVALVVTAPERAR